MKRLLSCLLAMILVFTPCIQAAAQEMGQTVQADTQAGQAAKGQVDVTIGSGTVLEADVTFTVSVTGQDGSRQENQVILAESASGEKPVQSAVSFEGLEAQPYTLEVKAGGFANYTQDFVLDAGRICRLELTTGFLGSQYTYGKSSPHPGVLLLGDANGDGVINDADKEALIDAVEAGSNGQYTDLNRSGTTDLADLECFTRSYGVEEGVDTQSFVEVGILASAQPGTGTSVSAGKIQDLMTNNGGSVQLTREDAQPISENSPVEVVFQFDGTVDNQIGGMVLNTGSDNPVNAAVADIVYTGDDGTEQTISVPFKEGVDFLAESSGRSSTTVTKEADGAICINLGCQVAVKRVTLKICGTKNNNNLAEISKVEFVGDMAQRIPEPAADIPENIKAVAGDQLITLSWNPCVNVTGYEVLVEQLPEEGKETQAACVKQVTGNSLVISSVGEGKSGKLVNGRTYSLRVRSLNGTWRSAYSDAVEAKPKTAKKPDPPDNVKATGKYKAIDVSWKQMEDTDSYNLYYKKDGAAAYEKITGIKGSSYTVTDLEDKTRYVVCVTGVNELGESGYSLESVAETTDLVAARMPRYKLLNRADTGQVSEHIISATTNGSMIDSPLDETKGTAWGTVDNDYSSYSQTGWDSGGFNNLGNNGLIYEFDQAYKIQSFALQEPVVQSLAYSYVKVRYWDEDGKSYTPGASIARKTDSDGRVYYMVRLAEPVVAKKIQFGLARYLASGTVTVSEVYFYHYDTLEEDIMALYADDLHSVLKSDVTQQTIDGLRVRINTPDEVSGELHPDKDMLERELKTAEDILNSELNDPARIHRSITTNGTDNPGRGFGGLNGWQPLGVSAAAGEDIVVYVGHSTMKTGADTGLRLVATQYHSESSPMAVNVASLKIGRNDITIPKIGSLNQESGGALYVEYTGRSAKDDYAVRVSGGTVVPKLDLYQVEDRNERIEKAKVYLTELQAHVDQMEALHEEVHKKSGNVSVNAYEYDVSNCILGATDLMLDTMMLSLPAQQILKGAGTGDAGAKKLVDSMDAMEEMMELFYQHKGLNNNAANLIDRFPSTHLNIRYQRMFAGAFMYASGNHIGIEYGSAPALAGGVPVQKDENGKYISGQYFGWGIAHEIGHCINQGSYAIAEVTNNYFSVLAQARDTNGSVRFQYPEVYKKVTSGTTGRASNVFTQLGMYWQLHLAYDGGYNYKTYEDHAEQLENLFFARVDSYSRTPGSAPKPDGVELKLDGGTDQNLMRLGCAAAGKNILEFFERWGMTPNEQTLAYANQFEKETRAIYYVNDDARVYRLEHNGSSLSTDGTTEAVGDSTAAAVHATDKNKVEITLDYKNIPENDLLGYEIVRATTSGGETDRQIAGFVPADGNAVYTDCVTTMNNRVVTYEVTVIDKYLNRSRTKILEPVKIEHEGNIDKAGWTVTGNGITASVTQTPGKDENDIPCGPEEEDPVVNVIDNNTSTVYTGTAGADAAIVLEFHQIQAVTGLQYTAQSGTPVKEYRIDVRESDGSWSEAAKGTFSLEDGKNVQTVYFAHNAAEGQTTGNIAIYNTDAVRLVIVNQAGTEISISELDVLGVTGDNVDFRTTDDGIPAIGKLKEDYRYGEGADDVIEAGSIIFTGSYKGNPAYNVVLVYDEDGNIVGGTDAEGNVNAAQVIFAEVPQTGNIRDVRDGTWVYYISGEYENQLKAGMRVRAELYRVDDAMTNDGQRMVSDSLFQTLPEELPLVSLAGSGLGK